MGKIDKAIGKLLPMLFPIRVEIVSLHMGVSRIRNDRAKKVKKSGDIVTYILASTGEEFRIDYSQVYIDNKGKEHVKLYNEAPGSYVPIGMKDNNFVPMEFEDKQWWILEQKSKERTLQDPNKTLQLLLAGSVLAFMGIVLVGLLLLMQEFQEVAEASRGIGAAGSNIQHGLEEVASKIAQACSGKAAPIPPPI